MYEDQQRGLGRFGCFVASFVRLFFHFGGPAVSIAALAGREFGDFRLGQSVLAVASEAGG